MPRVILILLLLAAAAGSRCARVGPPPLDATPRVGDHVRLRGTLGEDVDCRLFRTESGAVYSLSARLRGYANGTKVCIEGTLTENTGCLQSPMIEVQRVRAPVDCR